MVKDIFGNNITRDVYGNKLKKKRKTLTSAQRIYFWEHPKSMEELAISVMNE